LISAIADARGIQFPDTSITCSLTFAMLNMDKTDTVVIKAN